MTGSVWLQDLEKGISPGTSLLELSIYWSVIAAAIADRLGL